MDRVRGPLGRAAAGVLQRPDRAEPEATVDDADHLVGGPGGSGATPSPPAARWAAARPASSAARSNGARIWRARRPTTPAACVAGIAVLVAVLVFLATRTRWRPTTPLRVGHRRAWGQTLTASWRMYGSRRRLFLGLGLVALPAAILIAFLQTGIVRAFRIGPELGGEGGGLAGRVRRLRRHGVDDLHPDLRPGRERARDGGNRCRASGRRAADLPARSRQREAVARRERGRGRGRDPAHAVDLPDPGCDLARRAAGRSWPRRSSSSGTPRSGRCAGARPSSDGNG